MDKKTINKIIQAYIQELVKNNFKLDKVYLFGSYVKEKATDNSDIDLAIVMKQMSNKFQVQLELMKLRRKIDLRIEPHPIKTEEFNFTNPFAKEVIEYGKEIEIT
ncbi:MAG: nucleotidyltransferase domain-containing protein [Bacteroidales bacterium]|nr:nucleotidyltransferase domain-containing protein [Bacteroidales bacterium]